MSDWTSIPVRSETFQDVKSLKRGGETFDELLQKMKDTYRKEVPA